MANRSDDLKCPECGLIACDHQSGTEFDGRNIVDPETKNGFNPVYWTERLRARVSIRLDPVSGAFWTYDSGVWREHRDVVTHHLPMMMGRTYRRGSAAHVVDRLIAELRYESRFIYPDSPDTRYISLPSGLFDLVTGEVVPHDPGVMTLYRLQVDPDFTMPTPEFDKFLDSVLVPGDRERVLDILAYLVGPGNPRQKGIMLTGSGRNGKGTLMRLVEKVVGSEFTSAVPLAQLSARFDAATLYGKALNMVGDIDGEHIAHTGAFKSMTGDDLVFMDVKHGRSFQARVWAVPVFSANQIPSSADTTFGYLRRWEVIQFPNQFDGKDVTLEDRLAAELPGIVALLLNRLAENGMVIRESEPGKEALDMFARRSDPVRQWLEETELSGFVRKTQALEDYRQWAMDDGRKPLAKSNFYDRVSAILGNPIKRKGNRGWVLPEQNAPQDPQNAPQKPHFAPQMPPESEGRSALTSEDVSEGAEGASRGNFIWGMDAPEPPSEARAEGSVRGTDDAQPPSEARGQSSCRAEVGEAWDIFLDEVPEREPMSAPLDPFA